MSTFRCLQRLQHLQTVLSSISLIILFVLPARQISAWQQTPDNSLLAWAQWQQVANYGQVYLWSYYVMNKFCADEGERVKFFRELVSDRDQGMTSSLRRAAPPSTPCSTTSASPVLSTEKM